MRITITLPDPLARRFLAVVPSRQRSATIARLLEKELVRHETALETACKAANVDTALNTEIDEWQGFEDELDALDEIEETFD